MTKNRPYMIALAGQFLFGVTLYGRNADALYYFTYVEGNQALFSTYSMFIILPSIIGAACFPLVFRLTNNKGRSASIFALLTGISMFCMYFFTVGGNPCSILYIFLLWHNFSFPVLILRSMRLFRTVWSMENGRPGSEMTDFSMRLFHWETKSEWRLELPCLQEFWACSDMLQTSSRMQRYCPVIKHSFTTVPGILWIRNG